MLLLIIIGKKKKKKKKRTNFNGKYKLRCTSHAKEIPKNAIDTKNFIIFFNNN